MKGSRSSTIVEDFNNPFPKLDITRQKMNKDKRGLEQHYNELTDTYRILIDIYRIDMCRIRNATTTEYTFLSARGTFSRIHHVLGQKPSLNQFKKNKKEN